MLRIRHDLGNVGSLETADASFIQNTSPFVGDNRSEITKRRLEVQDWLPAASEVYHISPHLKDYVIVPVSIVVADLPNRNSVAFSTEELLRFIPSRGMPAYKTWKGQCCYAEHNNSDITKAKGIIFDSVLQPISNTKYNSLRVVTLCGFDSTKDAALANAIYTKKRSNYSMGAYIDTYECSICGTKTHGTSKETACGHVRRGELPLHNTKHGLKPAYYLARGIDGFEVSSVSVPAWVNAQEDERIFRMVDY